MPEGGRIARRTRLPGRWLRRGETLALLVLGVVALVLYVLFLNGQETRAARYMERLREADPGRYLVELKKVRGFDAYLTEYQRLFAFDSWRGEVPEFLLGRWSVSATEKRVSDAYLAADCIAPLILESGRLTLPGASVPLTPVQYRILGHRVEARLPDGAVLAMTLVASGVYLHHLELTLPGRSDRVFAYRCK